MAMMLRQWLLSKEHAKVIADTGGVVGVNIMQSAD
jgi:microsomal dipeptidase-like Zn-dependent dipeptidase